MVWVAAAPTQIQKEDEGDEEYKHSAGSMKEMKEDSLYAFSAKMHKGGHKRPQVEQCR